MKPTYSILGWLACFAIIVTPSAVIILFAILAIDWSGERQRARWERESEDRVAAAEYANRVAQAKCARQTTELPAGKRWHVVLVLPEDWRTNPNCWSVLKVLPNEAVREIASQCYVHAFQPGDEVYERSDLRTFASGEAIPHLLLLRADGLVLAHWYTNWPCKSKEWTAGNIRVAVKHYKAFGRPCGRYVSRMCNIISNDFDPDDIEMRVVHMPDDPPLPVDWGNSL